MTDHEEQIAILFGIAIAQRSALQTLLHQLQAAGTTAATSRAALHLAQQAMGKMDHALPLDEGMAERMLECASAEFAWMIDVLDGAKHQSLT